MNRFITIFNVVGITALAVVAAVQWRVENKLRHRRDELAVVTDKQSAKIRTAEAALGVANDSLEEFRKRVEVMEADNAKLTKELRDTEKRAELLTADVARLEKTVVAWKTAVDERDKAIGELHKAVKEQADGRNEAIGRYNDLVGKYNDLAKRTTDVEKMLLAARAERDKALEQLKAALAVNES